MINRDKLPPELVAQLCKPKPESLSDDIVEILSCGEEMTADEILVELYQRFGHIVKKNIMCARITTLVASEDVVRVKRGIYKIRVKSRRLKRLKDDTAWNGVSTFASPAKTAGRYAAEDA